MESMVNKEFWENRNVFITGCTGLLGSWLVKSLIKNKANIVGLIRDWVPRSNLILEKDIDKITTVRGQIEDYSLIERVLNEYEIDTVFHLAAQTIVSIANRNPISTFDTNIKGTYNLLEACRRNNTVKRIVVASSDKAYGDQIKLPYTEDTALQGRHPYDVSKSCVDLISRAYYETYKLPVCITRCGNFYGAGDLNFNRIVPGTIRSIVFKQNPVIRSDGKYIRDYLYIEDAVYAYIMLAENMEKLNIFGEAFNFSNEIQITVSELVQKILDIAKAADLEPVILNEVSGEINHQYLSAQKAKKILKWKPIYSIDEGLAETVKWYIKFFNER